MRGRTHIQGGYLFGNLTAYVFLNILAIQSTILFGVINQSLEWYALILVGAIIGSLFPDFDTPSSIISNAIPIISPLISLLIQLFNKIVIGLIGIIGSIFKVKKSMAKLEKLFHHRGLLHTFISVVFNLFLWWFMVIIISPIISSKLLEAVPLLDVTIVPFYMSAFFAGYNIGYISHIFLDMFNPMGVRLFLPFSMKSFKLGNVTVGSMADKGLEKILATINIVATVLIALSIIKN